MAISDCVQFMARDYIAPTTIFCVIADNKSNKPAWKFIAQMLANHEIPALW